MRFKPWMIICLDVVIAGVLFVALNAAFFGSDAEKDLLSVEYKSVLLENSEFPNEYVSTHTPEVERMINDLVLQECEEHSSLEGDWKYRVRLSSIPDGETDDTRYYFIYENGYMIDYPDMLGVEPKWYELKEAAYMQEMITGLNEFYSRCKDGYLFRYSEVGTQHGTTNGNR